MLTHPLVVFTQLETRLTHSTFFKKNVACTFRVLFKTPTIAINKTTLELKNGKHYENIH